MSHGRDRWNDALRQLAGFRKFLAPSLPEFRLVNLTDRQWTNEEYKLRKLVHRGDPGVYLMYSESGMLIYIGKAEWSLDSRVWSHDSEERFAAMPRRWIDAVVIPQDLSFLVPALESFLIRTLNPIHNRVGRGFPVPDDPAAQANPAQENG
jgi:hypothetical protein